MDARATKEGRCHLSSGLLCIWCSNILAHFTHRPPLANSALLPRAIASAYKLSTFPSNKPTASALLNCYLARSSIYIRSSWLRAGWSRSNRSTGLRWLVVSWAVLTFSWHQRKSLKVRKVIVMESRYVSTVNTWLKRWLLIFIGRLLALAIKVVHAFLSFHCNCKSFEISYDQQAGIINGYCLCSYSKKMIHWEGHEKSTLYLRFVIKASSPVQTLLISQASNLNRDYEQALTLALAVRLIVLKSKSFR